MNLHQLMPSIGLEIPEIDVEIRNLRKQKTYVMPNLITACKSVNLAFKKDKMKG